jgi:hypothetical protein
MAPYGLRNEHPFDILGSRSADSMDTTMRLHAVVAAAILLGSSAYALEPGQYPSCKQAGLEYSEGATICECPSLKAVAGFATGGPPGLVVSGRLQCRSGAWLATDAKCVELTGASQYMVDEHRKLYELYCPRQNTAEEINSTITKATPTQGTLVLSSICRRFGVPPAACAAVLEAISASQK